MKMQIFPNLKYDLNGHLKPLLCYVGLAWFLKTFIYFNKVTTLTYVLKGNFCPCFILFSYYMLSFTCRLRYIILAEVKYFKYTWFYIALTLKGTFR